MVPWTLDEDVLMLEAMRHRMQQPWDARYNAAVDAGLHRSRNAVISRNSWLKLAHWTPAQLQILCQNIEAAMNVGNDPLVPYTEVNWGQIMIDVGNKTYRQCVCQAILVGWLDGELNIHEDHLQAYVGGDYLAAIDATLAADEAAAGGGAEADEAAAGGGAEADEAAAGGGAGA